ncbi:MAG: hypothetical protein HRU18_11145 [Pseudoalteromonas sp.]|uniref:hypothetical protein n=1 Tax=Pseudoalteromonas sp. TaxID=53249 RepID=UPI001D4C004F|nr:hypothetical protein [Pseudoalteromonas sp.]NRA78755.1 hypothetical protein [Pseudoalteromonas sp.]
MNHVYEVLDIIKDELRNTIGCNTVSFGLLSEVDLDKTTIFPLAHIIMGQARPTQVVEFDFTIILADIVDENKEEAKDDEFYGNNNLQDVLNTQFEVGNRVISRLRRSQKFRGSYELVSDPTMDVMIDRFSNLLAGWELNFTVGLKNGISIC